MAGLVLDQAIRTYESRTPRSFELYQRALELLPQGMSRGTLASEPYPFYAAEAKGAFITDVDGNRYLDFVNNYTSLPHGHAHEATTSAVIAELNQSSAIGTASPREAQFAALLRERVPALERLHFATTGSEAVGFAVRAARAFTGRSRILKFEGAFHGSHNELYRDIASMPPLPAGDSGAARPSSAGLESSGTITAVYNDAASLADAFDHWGPELAAVVFEPFLGNSSLVAATSEFVQAVFHHAHRTGTLVVFDEVQSLRVGYSGAQGAWGVTPDLCALGKIIGGGYPLAAFGGRADIMSAAFTGPGEQLLQTGTFTAAPAYLAAGQAALEHLGRAEYAELEQRTERLRAGVRDTFARAGVPVQVNGRGSMFNFALSAEPVVSYRAHRAADYERLRALRLGLLNRGILIMSRGTGCVTTAMTDVDIDDLLVALGGALAELTG